MIFEGLSHKKIGQPLESLKISALSMNHPVEISEKINNPYIYFDKRTL